MGLITKDCIHNRSTQDAHRRLIRTLVSPYVCVKVPSLPSLFTLDCCVLFCVTCWCALIIVGRVVYLRVCCVLSIHTLFPLWITFRNRDLRFFYGMGSQLVVNLLPVFLRYV
jgi:hypothetical protein